MRVLSAFAVVLGMLAAPVSAWAQAADPIYQYADDDARMNGAIAEAREYLPHFFSAYDSAPTAARPLFMLKAALEQSDGGFEHIWVDHLERDGARWRGLLANEPDNLPGLHRASPVSFEEERISDWAIVTQEGLYGSYTMRVILDDLSPQEAAEYRAMLTPEPLPASWKD